MKTSENLPTQGQTILHSIVPHSYAISSGNKNRFYLNRLLNTSVSTCFHRKLLCIFKDSKDSKKYHQNLVLHMCNLMTLTWLQPQQYA